jgi:hypothetical protein
VAIAHILTGLALLWIGLRVMKHNTPKPLPRSKHLESIAQNRTIALNRAARLITQLETMLQKEHRRLESLEVGLDLNSQVAIDAINQADRAKKLIRLLLESNGCSEEQIEELLAQIEQ